MISFEKIGLRIQEQRKYIRRVSQEKMAESLGMYQADISNMEKAKRGSGITDLYKLDMIADYLGISLETLLFGKADKSMKVYSGSSMVLKKSSKVPTETHRKKLSKLLGCEIGKSGITCFNCGPYSAYVLAGITVSCNSESDENGELIPDNAKISVYLFCNSEVVCCATADATTAMQHVYEPALQELQFNIPVEYFDVTDVLRTLNPYWALYTYSGKEEAEEYRMPMYQRMDDIRKFADMTILYVESIYVREDYRRLGIFRMCIDIFRRLFGDCMIWLNMEPTAGAELIQNCGYTPIYTVSEVGQINMNAAIAEKLGFTIDPEPWKRQAEVLDTDGNSKTETIHIRKYAYYLPEKVRELVNGDGDLVAVGRAKQKLQEQAMEDTGRETIRDSEIDGFAVIEWEESIISGPNRGRRTFWYAAYNLEDHDIHKFGVSNKSVFQHGLDHDGQIEQYEYLDDAVDSSWFDKLFFLNRLVWSKILPPEEAERIVEQYLQAKE